jgi:hypothetical protein
MSEKIGHVRKKIGHVPKKEWTFRSQRGKFKTFSWLIFSSTLSLLFFCLCFCLSLFFLSLSLSLNHHGF